MTWATEQDIKTATDFYHEWIDETARLDPDSVGQARILRDALAALIHAQRAAAMKEGLEITVTEPIVLIAKQQQTTASTLSRSGKQLVLELLNLINNAGEIHIHSTKCPSSKTWVETTPVFPGYARGTSYNSSRCTCGAIQTLTAARAMLKQDYPL